MLNEDILRKVFAYDDSASEARTPCIAKGWAAVRRGPYIPSAETVAFYRETDPGEFIRRELDLDGLSHVCDWAFSPNGSLLAVVGNINSKGTLYDAATGDRLLAPRPRREN